MAKYRKKPVVIDAVQYAGDGNMVNRGEVPPWIWDAFQVGTLYATDGGDPLKIQTLEGDLTVSPKDWIVRGVKGEIYPCKPDVFEVTYEGV